MGSNQEPVTELVQMKLIGSWSDYKPKFEREFLPLLCSAPGMISCRSGPKLLGSHGETDAHEVVSITQWQSLEAHGAFVKSERGQKFLQNVGEHLNGPPTITHHDLGPLDNSENWVVCSSDRLEGASSDHASETGKDQEPEDDCGTITMAFFPTEGVLRHAIQTGSRSVRSFGIHVQSYGEGQDRARL